MPVTITKPAMSLREELAALRARLAENSPETFWFSGTGAQTAYPMPRGWKPRNVFVAGLLQRPGAGEDYTVSYDGFIHTVTFFVAPAVVDVGVICVREA